MREEKAMGRRGAGAASCIMITGGGASGTFVTVAPISRH